MATIRDVAKHAQVSVATVSRVLNKKGYVNKETEQKVLQAMKELDFKPNSIARSLSVKKTKTIALIVPDITNPFFPEIARAIEDTAQLYGYTVILCNSDEKHEKERDYIELLKQKYIDGIILASNTYQLHNFDHDIPIVVLDRTVEEQIPTVVSKNKEGAILATKHLLDIGCQQIAHICGPKEAVTARERLDGFIQVVSDQPWFTDEYIVDGDFDIAIATEQTIKLLAKFPEIDGIFAGNDLMAVGALKAAYQLGIKVPEDLAIIGFDNISLSQIVVPEISTIAQPIYEMGELATKILLKRIENKDIEEFYYELDVALIQRDSTNRKET